MKLSFPQLAIAIEFVPLLDIQEQLFWSDMEIRIHVAKVKFNGELSEWKGMFLGITGLSPSDIAGNSAQ